LYFFPILSREKFFPSQTSLSSFRGILFYTFLPTAFYHNAVICGFLSRNFYATLHFSFSSMNSRRFARGRRGDAERRKIGGMSLSSNPSLFLRRMRAEETYGPAETAEVKLRAMQEQLPFLLSEAPPRLGMQVIAWPG